MTYKIRICTSSCPYCGATVGKEYHSSSPYGLKFGRCPNCKKIFKTGKMLYSDISQENRDEERKGIFQFISVTIPLFILSVFITIYTGWALVGLLGFFLFMPTVLSIFAHFQNRSILLSKYSRLKNTDPELYQLEYSESLKYSEGRSIEEIEFEIKNAIEHKIAKYIGCLALSILASEAICMIFIGDSIEGTSALLTLFGIAILISLLLYYFWTNKSQPVIKPQNSPEYIINPPLTNLPPKEPSSLKQITPNEAENDTIVLGTIDNVSTPPVTHSLPLKQDDSVRICISKPNDAPIAKQRGTYGDDIRIHKPTQSNKQDQKTFSVDVIADGLAELCIKELIDIMGICHKHNVSYDEKKLIISTFCYFYTIWTVNYGQIKLKNYQELESRYTNHFCNFNRAQFETASYKDVIENEHVFKEQLVRVDKRVRKSYHANDGVFVDDGISDEFILEFIESSNDKERIKAEIVLKILKNWAHVAHQAGKHSVIDE